MSRIVRRGPWITSEPQGIMGTDGHQKKTTTSGPWKYDKGRNMKNTSCKHRWWVYPSFSIRKLTRHGDLSTSVGCQESEFGLSITDWSVEEWLNSPQIQAQHRKVISLGTWSGRQSPPIASERHGLNHALKKQNGIEKEHNMGIQAIDCWNLVLYIGQTWPNIVIPGSQL